MYFNMKINFMTYIRHDFMIVFTRRRSRGNGCFVCIGRWVYKVLMIHKM